MKVPLRILNLLLLTLFISGCAAKSIIQTEKDFKLRNYKTVSVNVGSFLPSCDEECDKEIKNIETLLIEKIKKTALFEIVSVEIQNPELTINIRITELRIVSAKDRFLHGALAGRAKVAGTIELFDHINNENLGKFIVEGISSGGTVFAGTTKQAVEKFIEQIINFIYEKVTI
ncbi:hypothetical protein QI155_00600 [Thermodesulfovibrio sp. 1176]|uniref:hypothetical protein n=1 Tax=Thermodesulfovibrio sp. 1176 TaxID=3043424 RepID=UPI0024829860|nr:hypothetical protein [Thermodesulfovibrio sp. 1176]MDI1471037.1 hypothetical protein [Thermodesulfovibrio sp. 1176]